jgi:hypothetical protein
METSKGGLLEDAVATVDRLIELAQSHGFDDSVQFLAMARTQLLIDVHGITDVEFRAFCDWLDGKQPPDNRRDSAPARVRRDGHLRGMRRAWLCPQDAAALRRGPRGAGRASR